MQTQIEFITDLSRQYKLYAENSEELFKAINELSEETLQSIYAEYGEGERNFQPVNLLRAEIARLRLDGVEITKILLEDNKQNIRTRQTEKFSHLAAKFLKQFAEYPIKSMDMFVNWQRDWSVFYTFFYRGETKKITMLYLEQMSQKLLEDLQLPDYKARIFDFQSPRSSGDYVSWIGLTPVLLPTHKDAYQFYLGFKGNLLAGLGVGSNLKDQSKDTEIFAENYESALEILQSYREEILSLNEQLLNSYKSTVNREIRREYFKFYPGKYASEWERFKSENVLAVDYSNLPVKDISAVESFKELNLLCDLPENSQSKHTGNLWQFKSAKIGDVVFIAKGVKNCIGIGIVEGEYFYDENAENYKHRRNFRLITDKFYDYQPRSYTFYATLFSIDAFSSTKPWQFILSEYVRLYPELKEVFDAENLIYDAPTHIEPDAETEIGEIEFAHEFVEADVYDFLTDAAKPFISEADFMQAVKLLKRKKNIILQGSPGVGKTFIARKLAYQIIGRRADSQIGMVQFHQSFAYEDFVQGLRLVKDGTAIKNGVFYTFCQLAAKHPEQKFFFIIDEINRGNLSKIFGELMMLIEHDKRDARYALKLTYADDEHEKFFVPPNVHLIGTMNTADRSLAIVDYALRRRFAFFDLTPQFSADFRNFLQSKGVSDKLTAHICDAIEKVNRRISEDPNLGAGFCIGHSYFCDGEIDGDEKQWFQEILQYEIRPLLEEIWFDDRKQVEESVAGLEF